MEPRSARVVLRITEDELMWYYGRSPDYPAVYISASVLNWDTVRHVVLRRCTDVPRPCQCCNGVATDSYGCSTE